jgi:hypothetical protein
MVKLTRSVGSDDDGYRVLALDRRVLRHLLPGSQLAEQSLSVYRTSMHGVLLATSRLHHAASLCGAGLATENQYGRDKL